MQKYGLEQNALCRLVVRYRKEICSGPLLPGHCDGLVRTSDVEQRHCRGMGNLPEPKVWEGLSPQPSKATLLLPQMPSCGGNEAHEGQTQTTN